MEPLFHNMENTWMHHPLSYWGLVTPFGDIDLGQHCLRWWLVAWRHQAITWTNVDLSLRSSDVHLRAILLEISEPSVTKISLKIAYLKLNWNLPGASELLYVAIFVAMLPWRSEEQKCYSMETLSTLPALYRGKSTDDWRFPSQMFSNTKLWYCLLYQP